MGFDPLEIHTTRIAASMGLGTTSVEAVDLRSGSPAKVHRPFKRATLAFSGVYPFEVRVSGACEGCLAWAKARMDRWNRDGTWQKILQKTNVVLAIGSRASLSNFPKPDPCTILAFGDCVPEAILAGKKAIRIHGCPPTDNIAPILSRFLEDIGVS
jgi:hypothetical protein